MPDVLTSATAPDTHEMVVIHRAFRRESQLLGELITAVPDGDTGRAGRALPTSGLVPGRSDDHHHGEDELLWPLLRQRAEVDAEIVVRMERQHDRVADTLTDVLGVLPAWQASAAADRRDQSWPPSTPPPRPDRAPRRRRSPFAPPGRPPSDGRSGRPWENTSSPPLPRPSCSIFLGAVLEEATVDERAALLGAMPLVARLAWRSVGRHRYASYIRHVRGNPGHESGPKSAKNLTEV